MKRKTTRKTNTSMRTASHRIGSHFGFGTIFCVAMTTALLAASAHAGGQTVVVTTLNDTVDFSQPRTIAQLPGPDGKVSFREALIAVNNTPASSGGHTIAFNIPTSEWWLYTDRALLRLEDGIFLLTRDHTVIDFTTQTDFTGDTNPDGNEVGIYGLQPNAWGVTAILVTANECVVIGLDRVMQRGYGVELRGNGNRVIGSTISGPLHGGVRITGGFGGLPATGNIIGGTTPEEGNALSGGNAGVRIEAPAEQNVVIGNYLTGGSFGVQIIGSQYTDYARDNRVGGPTPEERNIISDAGSYCCEGAPSGAQIQLSYATNNLVEGNYIGTTPDGLDGAGQIGPYGIDLLHAPENVIRDNVIADIRAIGVNHYAGQIFGVGIYVRGASSGNVFQGNVLGLGADGTTILPNHRGMTIAPFQGSPSDLQIGGVNPGDGNTIAYSDLWGISVSTVGGVTISGNAIFENGSQGIILTSGANGSQPGATITEATVSASSLTVEGAQATIAGQEYRIEFFASALCDSSGFGEGERFLGWIDITASGAITPFVTTLVAQIEEGEILTSTTTRLATGNTSAFTACVPIEAEGPKLGDLSGDGVVDGEDLGALLVAWGDCAECADCPADLNGDCKVDGADLGILLSNWGGK